MSAETEAALADARAEAERAFEAEGRLSDRIAALQSSSSESANQADAIQARLDAAEAARDAAQAERDAAQTELEAAAGERDAAQTERDAAQTERDAAQTELDAAQTELDALRAAAEQAPSLDEELAALRRQAADGPAADELDSLRSERDRLSAENDALRAASPAVEDDSAQQIEAMEALLTHVRGQQRDLASRLEAAVAERDALLQAQQAASPATGGLGGGDFSPVEQAQTAMADHLAVGLANWKDIEGGVGRQVQELLGVAAKHPELQTKLYPMLGGLQELLDGGRSLVTRGQELAEQERSALASLKGS